ncbi:MAG: NADH-quinone oxidoreductase subunit NuoK [Anaerolineae bacterium]|nr:NADH-quinone oxidoreductase subunit NuoK [Anaerolineae bacterium]
MIPLTAYLVVAALLFCLGIFTALSRRNAVGILLGVELMLNAVNLNLVAFWRYLTPGTAAAGSGPQVGLAGQVFAAFVFVVAAAEAAVGLALFLAVYRTRRTIIAEEVDTMRY